MSSHKHRRALALTLALSAGALVLPSAQAAPAPSGPPPVPVAIQDALFNRSFLETVQGFWGWLKDSHDPGDHSGRHKEGSGVCPHGGGHGPGH
jgi:hypothetical protein